MSLFGRLPSVSAFQLTPGHRMAFRGAVGTDEVYPRLVTWVGRRGDNMLVETSDGMDYTTMGLEQKIQLAPARCPLNETSLLTPADVV